MILFSFFLFSLSAQAQSSTSISYLGTPYCNASFATVTRSGDSAGGIYSATPIGLVIDSLTGTLDLEKSIPQTYTVVYDLNCLTNKCTYSTSVTIHSSLSYIKYASDTFCQAVLMPVQSVILKGIGTITGGIFTSTPLGLSYNSITGDITPSLSAYGNYQIIYSYIDPICGTIHDTTRVSIVDKVTPQITIVANADTICQDTYVTFTAKPVNGGIAPIYQWFKNGLPIKDSINITLTYIPLDNDRITCKMVSNNECIVTTSVTSKALTITVNKPTSGISNVFTCCGVYIWHGTTYTTTGTYTYDSLNVKGCDSLITLNLTITQPPTRDTMVTTCNSFTWNGINYTSTGNITLNLKNAVGCDSVITLHLTINQPSTGDTTAFACSNFTWYGKTYTSSATDYHTFMNVIGCDSVVTLHLTISQPTSADKTIIACGSLNWYGTNYTSSGTATHTFTNVNGCDSIVTLHLTINQPTIGDSTVTACGSFSWYGTNYTSSGTTTHTFKNAAGCDSVVTLHLTINQPSKGDTTAIVCNSFNWHGTTYINSGIYKYNVLNAKGCDSLVTLQLTINLIPAVTPIIGLNTVYVGQKIDLTDNTISGIWSSQYPFIATVDNAGQLVGVSKGIDTIYYVVSNTCGADTANFRITVLPNTLFIPNVFSPNGSGINDKFLVRGAGILVNQMELRIFDSWGNELFLSKGNINDRSKGWDGTYKGQPQPAGVYVYVARIEMKTGEIQIKKGAINLIR